MTGRSAGRAGANREPPSVSDATMRAVLGQFCSGVVVVTAAAPDGPVGFTCQSFASLSLDPPLVAFFASHGSTSWPRIREVGRFCVNVLASEHVELSTRFAVSGGDKFARIRWSPSPSGSPILEGVCAWVDCTLEAEHPGGDHDIVVGRVEALDATAEAPPLLFYRGTYRLLAEPEDD